MAIPEPIFLNRLDRIGWTKIYARPYGVQYSEMAVNCLGERARYHIPHPSSIQVVVPDAGGTAFYIDRTAWSELVESLSDAYVSDISRLQSYETNFVESGEEYLRVAKRLATLRLPALTSGQLINAYRDYQKKLFRYSVFAWTSFILNDYVSSQAEKILVPYLEKVGSGEEKRAYLTAVFTPEKKAAALELSDEIDSYRGQPSDERFEQLYVRFRWLACLDLHNRPWTREEFRQQIDASHKKPPAAPMSLAEIGKGLSISSADLRYLKAAQRFVYIKDARDDFRRRGVYHALAFFEEVTRRLGIEATDISYLEQDEVVACLEGRQHVRRAAIARRKRGFVLYLDKESHTVCLVGDDADQAVRKFKLPAPSNERRSLQGNVASAGIASGPVAIVRGVSDLNNVREGSVLVAASTHPDYVAAMRRSVAIVTDEGGVTSHAAIVAREFGLPCIVGTKFATSVLKDGDLIRVDAVSGRITRLS